MKSREIDILKIIIDYPYVNTPILCEKMSLSKRTIRYAISTIRTYLKENNCELLYTNQRGFHFSKSDMLTVEVLITELMRKQVTVSNYQERILYLQGVLLFNHRFEISNVANTLFTERSIIIKDLKSLKELYPEIKIVKDLVIWDVSFERQLQAIINIILKQVKNADSIYNQEILLLCASNYDEVKLNMIKQIVTSSNLNITNKYLFFQMTWFSYFILNNRNISFSKYDDIIVLLQDNFKKYEFNYILKILDALGLSSTIECSGKVIALTTEFLTNISCSYNIDFDQENYAFAQLLKRINSIKLQSELNIDFKYSQTERIIRLYPYSFSIAQQLLNIHGLKACNNSQVAYLCKYIQIVLFETAIRKAIVIISDVFDHTINYYIKWIKYQYSKNVKIILYSPNEFKSVASSIQGIDLIIDFSKSRQSSINQTIYLDQVLSIENVNKIDHNLKRGNSNLRFMSKFINQGLLKIYLNDSSISDSLSYASEQLFKRRYIENADKYIEECMKREQVSSTYIGFNTMIMHPLQYNSKRNALHISVFKQPLKLEEGDVQIIITCAFKDNIDFEISRLFELLMRIVESESNRRILIASQSEMDLFINLRKIISEM